MRQRAAKRAISVNTVKKQNRANVFHALLDTREITRTELARATGLSLGTITTIIDELAHHGLASETKSASGSVGRKPNIVKLELTGKRVIAIDLSSNHLRFELLNSDLSNVLAGQYRFESVRDYEAGIRSLCVQIQRELESSGVSDEDIIGIGVAAPGPYDPQEDRVNDPSFPELGELELQSLLREYFSHPVTVDHDVFLAARAEIRYVPSFQEKVLFYLFLGEGVGGALASNGEIHKGARSDAGEVGNVLLDGKRRFEELVSWKAISNTAAFADSSHDELLRREFANRGSSTHRQVVKAASHVAAAIHEVYWIVDPHGFIVGGFYQLFGEEFLGMVKSELDHMLPPSAFESLDLRLPRLGARSALIGAAELTRESWLDGL